MTCRKKIRTGELEQNRKNITKGRSFVYLVMLIKLIFRQSIIVYIRISSLLIVKTNNFAISSGNVSYIIMFFFKVCGYENSYFFHGCKNIHLICLISVAVIYEDYRNQSDRLSC